MGGPEIELNTDSDAPVVKTSTFLPWVIVILTGVIVWAVFTIVAKGIPSVTRSVAVAAATLAGVFSVICLGKLFSAKT